MRGDDVQREARFSSLSPEARVPRDHPLRPIRKMVNQAVAKLNGEVRARWLVEEERAVKCMKKDLFGWLVFCDFPPEIGESIRITSILERAFREVRRRTMPINNCFTHEAASHRIM
jgi:transposase-like protein